MADITWTPQKQQELEKDMTNEERDESRDALTTAQYDELKNYEAEQEKAKKKIETKTLITAPTSLTSAVSKAYAKLETTTQKTYTTKHTELSSEIANATGTKKESLQKELTTLNNDFIKEELSQETKASKADITIKGATTAEQYEQIYSELKKAYEDVGLQTPKELTNAFTEIQNTIKATEGWLTEDEQQEIETAADKAELEQEGTEELQKLEKETKAEEAAKEAAAKEEEVTEEEVTEVKPTETKAAISEAAKETIITRTEYPKWWRNLAVAPINCQAPGSQTIVSGHTTAKTYIHSIFLIVSGDTTITLNFGSYATSGPMNFGGTDEPRGISIPMGEAPASCGRGGLGITATGNILEPKIVGGFAVFSRQA